MFCTACASLNPASVQRCLTCSAGIGITRAVSPSRRPPSMSWPGPSVRRRLARILYLFPVVMLILAGGGIATRYRAERDDSAASYARAEAALADGEYAAAIAAFAAAGPYRDAIARRAETATALAPYRAAYLDGVAALDAGRYQAAIEALLPIVRDLPGYENAAALLEEARRRQGEDLVQQVDLAEARRDWLAADRALSTLLANDPENEHLAARLSSLRRTHAPILFCREGDLYVVGPDLADERLLVDEVPAAVPVWSPDRTRIAFYSTETEDAGTNTRLYVVDADGTHLTLLAEKISFDGWPAWSPDGARIAFTSIGELDLQQSTMSTIRYVDVTTGDVRILTGHDQTITHAGSPSWSPTGDRIAFVNDRVYASQGTSSSALSREGEVFVVDLATGATTSVSGRRVTHAQVVRWSPTAEQLLIYALDQGSSWYEEGEPSIHLLDLTTEEIEDVTDPEETVGWPVWAPDGNRFAYVEGERVVHIRTLGQGDAWVNAARPLSGLLAWSPDSMALIAISQDPTQASSLIPLDDGPGVATDLQIVFDLSLPNFGPPQWSPYNPSEIAGPPSLGGTAFDSA